MDTPQEGRLSSPLLEAMLEISRIEHEDVDAQQVSQALERLALRAQARAQRQAQAGEPTALERLQALVQTLVHDEGFIGARQGYEDPANCHLHLALERRCGLPITLSVLAIEVGRRAGVRLVGVGFPFHFLAGSLDCPGLYVDLFEGAQLLDEAACAQRLSALTQGRMTLRPEHLSPCTTSEIVTRALRNLKRFHLQRGDEGLALRYIDEVLKRSPQASLERRDRGLILMRLRCWPQAVVELEAALAQETDARARAALLPYLDFARRQPTSPLH